MSAPAAAPQRPDAGAAHIPTPPKMPKRRKRRSDAHWLIWAAALAVGIGAGVAGYRFLPGVERYFDYWLVLVLG